MSRTKRHGRRKAVWGAASSARPASRASTIDKTERVGRPSRASSQAGLSLIEATIILSVVATLSAVLAPSITDTIGVARIARAREDVQVIGNAIQNFVADNAEGQFLLVAHGPTNGQPPTRPDSNRVNLLVSDGDIPALGPAVSTETYWTQPVNNGTVDTLSNHLAQNDPGNPGTGANRYRNPSDVFVATPGGNNIDFARSSSSSFNAPFSWRGAYLKSPVDPDPWGFRYAVNVVFLDPNVTAAVPNITAGFAIADYPRLDVFVLSGGPDKEIDTMSAQDGAVPGDDDIIFIVSSNAR